MTSLDATPTTARWAWVNAGWLIEHTGGGCEALTRYYLRGDGATITVVLTADLAVPDGPRDQYIDPLGVYIDDPADDPDLRDSEGWGREIHHPFGGAVDTYWQWRAFADYLALAYGAVQDVTYPADPYRGAGLAPDLT